MGTIKTHVWRPVPFLQGYLNIFGYIKKAYQFIFNDEVSPGLRKWKFVDINVICINLIRGTCDFKEGQV
jgi:hypothetical protein